MQLMQPKEFYLRWNREQVHLHVDGMMELRKTVESESLPIFDSQFKDTLDQLHSQGLSIIVPDPEPEPMSDDAAKAIVLVKHILNATQKEEDIYARMSMIREDAQALMDMLLKESNGSRK